MASEERFCHRRDGSGVPCLAPLRPGQRCGDHPGVHYDRAWSYGEAIRVLFARLAELESRKKP